MELGRIGIWSSQFRTADASAATEAARDLQRWGYGALWVPGGAGGDILGDVGRLLTATDTLVLATGILNIWMHEADEVAEAHARLQAAHPGRFLLGLGVSHAALVERATDARYRRPLAVMVGYLDRLDAADVAVPVAERVLAALGPKMLELAARRAAGAHPYLVDPAHTARARGALGPDRLLAPEQKVVFDTDPASARALARKALSIYLGLPNYTDNLRRLGYSDDDVAPPGSDRLVDGLVAWGDVDAIGARVDQHLAAGADHVCLQVLNEDPRAFPRRAWEALSVLTGVNR